MEKPCIRKKKLVIVGDSGSGKTCLLASFSKEEFPTIEVPAVLDTFVINIEVEGKVTVELELCDTAGQEGNGKLRQLLYPDTDVVLLVFAINSRDSLKNITKNWNPELKHFCNDRRKVLVGTKKDLRCVAEEKANVDVSPEKGRLMAERIGAFAYIECSAKNKEGVQEVLETAARAAVLGPRCVRRRGCQII